ncbi:hypothetical protein HOD38_00415 [archaeon]|nr:hypothetical protein [archaeon]MBT4396710.1 hypothetical protein [archaeon]MBT4441320.1 hypothetical protein [archaeon]
MNAEQIATKARKSISKFCFEECSAYCCRKGYIILSKEELDLIKGKEEVVVENIKEGKFTLFLGATCPALKPDFKCKIHKNALRPQTCKDFPIFIKGEKIGLSGRCLAVKQDKFFPFIKQWNKLGYQVYISDSNKAD